MNVTKVTVDGSEFFLAADQSVEETKNLVIDAVQHGGGLIELKVAGHGSVSVLVSQSIPIVFETIETPEARDEGDDENWDWDEFSFLAS